MDSITPRQAMELIDIAAQENRLYHHNGGQAYIRVTMDSNVLMVIDHSSITPTIDLYDGTKYFEECKDYNWSHSARLREYGSLSRWYDEHIAQSLETV
jgi:hypothetical protein